MGKKEKGRAETVLNLLTKQQPLTLKQEKFCNDACIERFLNAKGDNVKKAAKQLRNCLAWRDSLNIDHLIADEFSAELAEGAAYVSGHDDESRPVVIFRIKQDYQKFHSQKLFRLLVFTLEVAIQTMVKGVQQFVILFDASKILKLSQTLPGVTLRRCFQACECRGLFRSASAFMNMLLATLKIITDYYPGRLYEAFVIDPPPLFTYLWKGVKAFVELAPLTMTVSSLDWDESLEFNDFTAYPRAASLRFNPSSTTTKIGSSSSSRFALTVSHTFDSLKPWSLTFTGTSSPKVGPTSLVGPAISPLNARSYSLARNPRGSIGAVKKGFFPSTPLPQKTQELLDPSINNHPRATMRPLFFQSPAMFFKKDFHVSKAGKYRESFVLLLKFYRRPYDEMTYRSKMRPPLGGLISIVSPYIIRQHISVSQRF